MFLVLLLSTFITPSITFTDNAGKSSIKDFTRDQEISKSLDSLAIENSKGDYSLSEMSIRERIDNDSQFKEIFESLKDKMPFALIKIIRGYIPELQDLLNIVMKKLRTLKGKEKDDIPNINESSFPNELYQMISSLKDESILQDRSFWSDLSLLFHEWINYMIKRNNLNDSEKPEILKNTKSLIIKINKKYPDSQPILDPLSINTFISSTINDRFKDDLRFKEIFNYFYSAFTKMPIDLIEIIGDYVLYHYDKTITGFLGLIMDDLGVSTIERNSLDLYSPFFASWLLKRIKEKKVEFPPRHQLWYDLDRFLFKWVLAMRRIFADNDQAFKALAPNIDSIIAIIHKNGFEWSDGGVSTLTSIKSNFSVFRSFIPYESIDNPDILRYFIDHVIKDVYDDHDHSILKIDCQELLNRYFDGQSFNSNPLLKMMLISLTPREISKQIKKECFPKEESSYLNYHEFTTATSKIYTQQDYSPKDIYWIESINGSYLSSKMIEFFLDNKLGFRIDYSSDLIDLLRRLERLKLLQKISLDRIIKFRIESEGNIWRWDISTFKKYLKEQRDRYNPHYGIGISPDEYDKLIKKYKIIQINNNSI
jgi:hypothetical protein